MKKIIEAKIAAILILIITLYLNAPAMAENKEKYKLLILDQELELTIKNPADFNPKCKEQKCILVRKENYRIGPAIDAQKTSQILINSIADLINYAKNNNWNDLAIKKFEITNINDTGNEGEYAVSVTVYAGNKDSKNNFSIIAKDAYLIIDALKNEFNLDRINGMIYYKYPKFRGYYLMLTLNSIIVENGRLTIKLRLLDIVSPNADPDEGGENKKKLEI